MQAWDRIGVAVKLMGPIPATLYTGEIFDSNVAPITPRDEDATGAIWCFCEKRAFATTILGQINSKLSIAARNCGPRFPSISPIGKRSPRRSIPTACPSPRATIRRSGFSSTADRRQSTAPLQVAVATAAGLPLAGGTRPRDAIEPPRRELVNAMR